MRFRVDQKVPVLLVMYDRMGFGIVKRRVAKRVFVDPKIMVKENSQFSRPACLIDHANASQESILMACYRVTTMDLGF